MEKIGIIGGADGPTAVMITGTGGLMTKLFIVLAVAAVVGVLVWVQHHHG